MRGRVRTRTTTGSELSGADVWPRESWRLCNLPQVRASKRVMEQPSGDSPLAAGPASTGSRRTDSKPKGSEQTVPKETELQGAEVLRSGGPRTGGPISGGLGSGAPASEARSFEPRNFEPRNFEPQGLEPQEFGPQRIGPRHSSAWRRATRAIQPLTWGGWIAVCAVVGAEFGSRRSLGPELPTWFDSRPLEAESIESAGPRLLRALPGIGAGRARAIVELGFERGAAVGLDDWESVPGIGGATVARVRRMWALEGGPMHLR